MNILTFDIEEWFHLLDNDSTRSEEQWKGFDVRIYENMERIFRILEETDTEATTKALKDFLQQTETQLEQMGRNGRKLVEEKYSSQKMAYDMVNLYRKILEQ